MATKTKKPKPDPAPDPPEGVVRAPAPPWPPAPFPVDAAVADLRVRANYAGLDFDPAANPEDAALVESVRTHGVLQNLLVRPVSKKGWEAHVSDDGANIVGLDHFEVVAGHRRLAAAKAAGRDRVPAECRWLKDDEVVAIQLVENDQRRQPKVSRQVTGYGDLAARGWTLERIAATTGKPVAFVRSVLALAKLPAWALAAVDTGALPRATAELVARVPGEVSRGRAAACVLWGQTDPARLLPVQVETLEQLGKKFAADYRYTDEPPLSYRDTKDLIRTHFQRQLKGAPFSLKVLYERPAGEDGRVSQIESCDACPKRAGNDPEAKAEGVRQDTCLDPDCFGLKVEAYRRSEIAKAEKKGAVATPEDFTWRMTFGEHPAAPKGWCLLDVPTAGTEIGEEFAPGACPPLPLSKVLGKDCPQQYVAFHKDKPRLLVRTAEARKALQAGGVLKKPEPRARPKPAPATDTGPKPAGAATEFRDSGKAESKADKPTLIDEFAVDERAADIGAKILGEFVEGNAEDYDHITKYTGDDWNTSCVFDAVRWVVRYLIRDHCEFGPERSRHVALALGFDPETGYGQKKFAEAAEKLDPKRMLALAVRLCAGPVLGADGAAKSGLAFELLEWAEMDWPHLRDQARRELAGGETADAKIDRALADDLDPPAFAAQTPLSQIDDIPDAVLDLLMGPDATGKLTLERVLGDCDAAMGVVELPLRNKLVAYFVGLGAKIKPAELAAKAIADHVEGKAVGK